MNNLPVPVVEAEASSRLEPLRPLETRAVAEAMTAYQEGLTAILAPSDYQVFTDKDGKERTFVKKSGWRKIALWFGLDLQLMDRTVERDERGMPLRARVVARAKAPNGRFADGDGYCSVYERRFAKPENDIPATAATRAMNRAVANLVGLGATSAEEIDGSDADRVELPAWAYSATPERIHVLREQLAELGLDEEHVQGLITAWGKAYESIPDLLVQVARGLTGALRHQQPAPPAGSVDDTPVVDATVVHSDS